MNENKFKAFQQVLVRYDADGEWTCDFYSHYKEKAKLHSCVGGLFECCIPYDGNEHLLGTKYSPQPKRWRAEEGGIYYFVNAFGEVLDDIDNHMSMSSNDLYDIGNYFRTQEEAEKLAEKFKAIIKGE